MVRLPRTPLWLIPLLIAGLVALFGWWGSARLRHTIEAQLRDELAVTLDANVTALEIWTTNQMKLATALAEEPRLRQLANAVLDHGDSGEPFPRRAASPQVEAFADYLRPRLLRIGYEVADLVNTNLVVAANTFRGRMRRGNPVAEEHTAKFSELFTNGHAVLITPFKPPRPALGRGFAPRRAPENGAPILEGTNGPVFNANPNQGRSRALPQLARAVERLRRGDLTLMQVAAPIRDDDDKTIRGALALIIDSDKEFTRILSVARSGQSGETYAFDQSGLLISRSRFDEQLKELGLIEARPDVNSALNLRLSDPGQDFPEKIAPEDTNTVTRPLIHLVSEAVAGGSGVSIAPSRDYRGVPVVGAWRWLPGLGFGVATQIDASEAFRPLRVLQSVFLILVLLLLLCAIGMFLLSCLSLVSRRRLSEAELKLKQLGQYTLEEKIGEGGMGVVYRARHALMRRDTAIKLLPPDKADPAAIERFEREVCLTCQLTHPNTIQVYDYGHTPDGVFYFAMEYLVGLNLHDLVHRYGPMPEGRVIHVLSQVCDSLCEAHALGLVHRDIKPANIFLCDRGGVPDNVKVLDFGLVRRFAANASADHPAQVEAGAVGTPSFMPPEAIQNPNSSDPRSDIYSIGALAYFLLTGRNVFEGDNVVDLYSRHLKETPAPPSRHTENPISPELESILLSCLEKDPARRPQEIIQLREMLQSCPTASDWGAGARASWWNQYHRETGNAERRRSPSTPVADATLRIDFASRMEE